MKKRGDYHNGREIWGEIFAGESQWARATIFARRVVISFNLCGVKFSERNGRNFKRGAKMCQTNKAGRVNFDGAAQGFKESKDRMKIKADSHEFEIAEEAKTNTTRHKLAEETAVLGPKRRFQSRHL
jgi:hypothetical protein